MSVSVFTSAGMSRAVSDLGHSQRTNRIRNQFPESSEVHLTDTLEYGHDVRHPHVLHFRKPGQPAGVVKAAVGTLKHISFPMLREKTAFNEKDARVLDPSVASYAGRNNTNVTQNYMEKVLKQLEYLRGLVDMTHVVNCYTALRTGSVTFNYPDLDDETINYGYGSAGTAVTSILRTALSGTTAPTAIWTHANALPLQNIDNLVRDIRATSQYGGDFDVLMGNAAWDAFRNHSTITSLLDYRRVQGAEITLRESSEYKGSVNNYDIYNIDTRYLLDTTWTQAWDTNTIAVVPRDNREQWFSTEFGAPFDRPVPGADPTFLPTPFFSKTFIDEDPPVKMLLVESRPIPLIKNPLCLRVQAVIS